MKKTPAPRPAPRSEVHPSFVPVVDAFAGLRDVSQRRMFSSSSVLSVNGRIFAMLVKGELVAKLPKQRVDDLVSSGKGDYFDPGHGRLMKQWVAVGPANAAWVELAKEAYHFVKAGKP